MSPSEFVRKVVESYEAGHGLYKNKINAEELVPEGLSDLSKAQFIFYVLQLDYAMKSQILYKGARILVSEIPNFFTPEYISELSDIQLTDYLKKYLHPRYINEAKKRYRINTLALLDKYNGDPRNLFNDTSLCSDVLLRLIGFRGFGPKIGNFFVRTMINTFNYIYADIEEILPPVDIHDVRIAFLLSYTDSSEMTKKNILHVKKLWNSACADAKCSWLVFDKALWLLGSEGKPTSVEDIISLLS